MRVGVYVYGLATVAAGILDLVWGEFEAAHQPIQALGDHIPGQTILAYVAAIWLVAGGAAILWQGTARAGAVALALIYLAFAAFWLPRFSTAPRVLGARPGVYLGVLGGACTQLILVAAAVRVSVAATSESEWVGRVARAVRWVFGVSALAFGLAHLTGVRDTAAMVPTWMPLGGDFWAVLTGIAFVLAGIAILSGVLDVLAARLLALMLLIFSAVALVPLILAAPGDHVAWGSNAYNLTAVGAVLIFADSIARRQPLPARLPAR